MLFAVASFLPNAFSQPLHSVDLRGNCAYVKGAPESAGDTKEKDRGQTLELVAYGSEVGHHCGEDQGRFAYAELEGDFDVTVQVAHVTNGGEKQFYSEHGSAAKAGLMARESNDPSARYVGIWAVSNDARDHSVDGYQFDLRKVPGAWLGNQPKGVEPHLGDAAATFVYGFVSIRGLPKQTLFDRSYPNVWLRLQRKDQTFSAWISRDGRTWEPTTIPSHKIDFAKKLHVGVALAAAPEGRPNARAEAVFKNLKGLQPVPPVAAPAGPVKVSDNGRYFTDSKGVPFFWLGDTAWPLFVEYSQEQAETYLKNRAAKGFTVIHSVLIWGAGSGMESEMPKSNTKGETPWLNNNPETPNEAYFKYVDHLVAFANRHGLVMALMPTWGYYVADRPTINVKNARNYGRWLGNRYKDATNIVWVSGGDRIPLNFEDVYRELAAGLQEGSGGRHMIGYHPSGWRSSAEYFHQEPWLSFNMVQSWTQWPQIHDAVISDALQTPAKPVIVSEPAYEDGPEYPMGPITPLIMRRQAWWTVMAGGSFTSGHTQMWRMDPGWDTTFDSPGAYHVAAMRTILSRFEWWDMVPDQGLFLSGVSSEKTLNTALRAKKGDRALLYLSSQCHVLVNFEKFKVKRVNAYWIDPITGDRHEAGTYATGNYNGRSFPDRASKYFATPDHWEDALLLIEDADAK